MPEQIPVQSVRTGGTDYIEVATPEEAHIEALHRERDGYLRAGKADRAAQVAAELRRLGTQVQDEEVPQPPPLEDAADRRPRQRASTRRGGR
ncbi:MULTISPECIES: hypothetical protein [unclassified Nonomuraea]|uniref:hypothetical protein n=1 Tax=unclassified Nonomuraea TaxID=2593643 RepID=UPI0033D2F53F